MGPLRFGGRSCLARRVYLSLRGNLGRRKRGVSLANSASCLPTPPTHVIGSSSPVEEKGIRLGAASTNPLNPAHYLMVLSGSENGEYRPTNRGWCSAKSTSEAWKRQVANPWHFLLIPDGSWQLSCCHPRGCRRGKCQLTSSRFQF